MKPTKQHKGKQKQESGGWEEMKYFEIVDTNDNKVRFEEWLKWIDKEWNKDVQEAERRGYRRIRKWTNGRNVTKDSLRAELNKLLKK